MSCGCLAVRVRGSSRFCASLFPWCSAQLCIRCCTAVVSHAGPWPLILQCICRCWPLVSFRGRLVAGGVPDRGHDSSSTNIGRAKVTALAPSSKAPTALGQGCKPAGISGTHAGSPGRSVEIAGIDRGASADSLTRCSWSRRFPMRDLIASRALVLARLSLACRAFFSCTIYPAVEAARSYGRDQSMPMAHPSRLLWWWHGEFGTRVKSGRSTRPALQSLCPATNRCHLSTRQSFQAKRHSTAVTVC